MKKPTKLFNCLFAWLLLGFSAVSAAGALHEHKSIVVWIGMAVLFITALHALVNMLKNDPYASIYVYVMFITFFVILSIDAVFIYTEGLTKGSLIDPLIRIGISVLIITILLIPRIRRHYKKTKEDLEQKAKEEQKNKDGENQNGQQPKD